MSLKAIAVGLGLLLLSGTAGAASLIDASTGAFALFGGAPPKGSYTEKGEGCEIRGGLFRVEDVIYNGGSEYVLGFRAREAEYKNQKIQLSPSPKAIYITDDMSRVEHSWLDTLVRRGSLLVISYYFCHAGNTATSYARDIYRPEFLIKGADEKAAESALLKYFEKTDQLMNPD